MKDDDDVLGYSTPSTKSYCRGSDTSKLRTHRVCVITTQIDINYGAADRHESIRHTVPKIIDALRLVLGSKLVAYIAGVSEARAVREWVEAARRPTPVAEDRLRLAHRIVTLLSQVEGKAIVPAWFKGKNPELGKRSPALVLHELWTQAEVQADPQHSQAQKSDDSSALDSGTGATRCLSRPGAVLKFEERPVRFRASSSS